MAKSTCLMPTKVFVSESLENYADSLPDGSINEATILRQAAAIYRGIRKSPMIRIQEEEEDFSQAAARIVKEATEKTD